MNSIFLQLSNKFESSDGSQRIFTASFKHDIRLQQITSTSQQKIAGSGHSNHANAFDDVSSDDVMDIEIPFSTHSDLQVEAIFRYLSLSLLPSYPSLYLI
jgi:hypothetical protein